MAYNIQVVRRWPVILTGVINDTLYRQNKLRDEGGPDIQAAAEEGAEIIRNLSRIKSEMSKDRVME
jgi:hypothetical protein